MLGDVHLCAVCPGSFGAGFSPGFTGQRAQIISNYHAPHLEYSTKNFVAKICQLRCGSLLLCDNGNNACVYTTVSRPSKSI